MVRPGIALYGYSLAFTRGGEPAAVAPLPLRPVLSWKTRVLTVKEVAAGQAVGYMGTFVTKTRSRIAVLPVGYADGYPRLLSNRARVIVGGEYAPVVGRVSMDLTIVDVSHIRGVAVGDEVILIGREQRQERGRGRTGAPVRKRALRNSVRPVAESAASVPLSRQHSAISQQHSVLDQTLRIPRATAELFESAASHRVANPNVADPFSGHGNSEC